MYYETAAKALKIKKNEESNKLIPNPETDRLYSKSNIIISKKPD